MTYQTHTLPSGLRIIHLKSDGKVVYCGLAVKAGTRNELSGEEGIAHLCEHLSFKGTSRRTATQILNALEGVGGELNAFTNKEDTVYYAAVTRQYLGRAIDVLTDIVFNSTFPEQEVEKEREVVCDEIESYEDTPSELIFDEFENLLFAGHPLGHNILGTEERVRGFSSADARRFTNRYYRPDNAIFFAYGDVDFRWLTQQVERAMKKSAQDGLGCLGDLGSLKTSPKPALPSTIHRSRGTHQAHVMLGTTAYSATSPNRWPLFLLNNILGGPALNSRLSLSLRERRGLVYSVDSQVVCYSDTGLWAVYFGCDPADVKRCLRLVRSELRRLAARPLTERQLAKAKQQVKGQLSIAADNREQFALDFAKTFLHHDGERSLDAIFSRIDSLTANDLHRVARELFDEGRMLTLIYE